MNPFKFVTQTLVSLFSIVSLGWFGLTCFRLGWQIHDNPFFSPIAALMVGEDRHPSEQTKPCHQIAGLKIGSCN